MSFSSDNDKQFDHVHDMLPSHVNVPLTPKVMPSGNSSFRSKSSPNAFRNSSTINASPNSSGGKRVFTGTGVGSSYTCRSKKRACLHMTFPQRHAHMKLLMQKGAPTLRSSHSMSSRGLLHNFSRSAYFFFSSFNFSRS